MLVISIPSIGRCKWLVEEYIKNITRYLIKPLRGQIKLFMYIQNPDTSYISLLSAMALKYDVEIFYTDAHKMNIAQVRYQSVLEAFKRYPECDHVLTADDDMFITGPRVADDYEALIKDLEPNTTYVLYPGNEYSIEDYKHPGKHSRYTPSMLRGQVYPREPFMSIDKAPLEKITVGEDYIMPRVLDVPIKWVTGFNENMHLCSRTITQRGILNKWYQWEGKEQAQYYWDLFKEKYNFDKNGYNIEDSTIGFEDYNNIYPQYFTKEGYYKY